MEASENIWNNQTLINVLQDGGLAVIPTDTIYGMVGKAENEDVVNRVYQVRKRDPHKPFIILIGDTDELKKFSINLSEEKKNILKQYWPGPVSIILDCTDEKFAYLHRGTKSLAFRMPLPLALRDLLLKTGPLIAPSANTEKFPASENVEDAKKYFGDAVDLYVDGGPIVSKASKIIRLEEDGSVLIVRV